MIVEAYLELLEPEVKAILEDNDQEIEIRLEPELEISANITEVYKEE